MDTRKNRFWLLPIVILICLFTLPADVGSQCNVISTMQYLANSPTTITIVKTIGPGGWCRSTMMNASSCFPGPGYAPWSMLQAVAMSATVNPSCAWQCTCGTGALPHFIIDSSDGLPVELMDFTIE